MPYVRRRPVRRRRAVHRDQRRVPRLPVHPDRQRAPAAGLPGARRQGPDERGAAQRDVVPPAVRAGPPGHRRAHSSAATATRPASLITAHAERSKQTMRRAMADAGRPHAGRGSSPRAGSPARSWWSPARPRASASRRRAASTPRAAPSCSPTAPSWSRNSPTNWARRAARHSPSRATSSTGRAPNRWYSRHFRHSAGSTY